MRTARKSAFLHGDRRRLIVGALAVCFLLVVGWRIFIEANASALARTDPEAALEWRGNAATALTVLAEQRLTSAQNKDDYAAAIELAESALVADPLRERAIALIALARSARGDQTGVEALMQRAAARSRRDTPIQGWLFNDALNRADYAGALAQADALLLTSLALRDEVLNSLRVFLSNEESRAALLARLALAPPWRTLFLQQLAHSEVPADVVFALLADLALSASPPNRSEVGALLDRLVQERQFDLAYVIWVHFLPKEQRGLLKYAFNGDFELAASGLPFDWIIPDNRGATAAIVESSDAGHGRVLHVEFANARADRVLASKILVLTPGHYQMTGSARTADLQNERGLVWHLGCLAKDGPALAATLPLKGTAPWRDFALDFEVPAQNCRGQILELTVPARADLEKQISGEAWFDDIVIERHRTESGAS